MAENRTLTKQQQKAKIRERYRGISPDVLEVIPAAKKRADFYDDVPRRVAVYVRVSTDDPRQTSSYELQKNYYEDMVQRHENWTLVEIYADEGISGTQLKHRDSFNRMIRDCRAGKIDLIVTKSVSRFARNIVDCISIVRELGALSPAVGVFFETEHIFTLKDDSEMGLSFQATMAQEESHVKSNIMNASIEMRFSHGIVLTPVLLGYDHDEDGNLIINEDEAKTVRLIFFMYLYGYTCQQIADALTELECTTKKGNTTWSSGSVLQQLRNERHCGEVLTRKTFTPSYLNHKTKKNMGDRTQHRWRDHHEAIISRDDFIAVQHLIDNAKYGNKGILPELNVVPEGALRGFVVINPRWAGFQCADYEVASESVYENNGYSPPVLKDVEVRSGDFDLRGFEIARSQFFDTQGKICVTFSRENIVFSTGCLRKFDDSQYIEMLVHPGEHLLAVRKADKGKRNALRWAKTGPKGTVIPRAFSGAAFIGTLYELFGWNSDYRYRVRGIRRQKDAESVLLFDMRETEVFMPQKILLEEAVRDNPDFPVDGDMEPVMPGTGKSILAYPSAWADNFGSNYYRHAQARELAGIDVDGEWGITEEALPYSSSELNTTPSDELLQGIRKIITEKKQEMSNHGHSAADHEPDTTGDGAPANGGGPVTRGGGTTTADAKPAAAGEDGSAADAGPAVTGTGAYDSPAAAGAGAGAGMG